MRYVSICSGIEAATQAWHRLEWEPVAFAEIDAFASAYLAHHYPNVPNVGDFTAADVGQFGRVDLLVGGTPCQAFSVAGNRQSLADARGNLSLAYTVLAHELARFNGLRWSVWENVPGVLSMPDNAFGCFLGSLVGHDRAIPAPRGRAWPDAGMVHGPWARAAWRVLDAQFFGLAQRRRRVFVVAGFGDGADPAQVLFERKSLRRDSPPRRETGQGIAGTIKASSARRGGVPEADDSASLIAGTVSSKWAKGTGGPSGDECQNLGAFGTAPPPTHNPYGDHESREGLLIAHALDAKSHGSVTEDGTGRGTPIVPICFSAKNHGADAQVDLSPTLRAGGFTESHANAGVMPAIAFDCKAGGNTSFAIGDMPGSLRGDGHGGGHAAIAAVEGGAQFEGPHDTANIRAASGGSSRSYVAQQWAVRRLTPRECERLQGFPDDKTLMPYRGKPAADGNRYKTIGNSMPVPVMLWIGTRIAAADAK